MKEAQYYNRGRALRKGAVQRILGKGYMHTPTKIMRLVEPIYTNNSADVNKTALANIKQNDTVLYVIDLIVFSNQTSRHLTSIHGNAFSWLEVVV